MAIARLPVILILYLLQDFVLGQQLSGLASQSKPNIVLTNNLAASDPRVAELISSAKNNQKCGNQVSCQPDAKQLTGLQQFLSLQQPTNPLTLQPLTVNGQPSPENQNLQQALALQQPLNFQQYTNQNAQQLLNLQPTPSVNLQSVNQQPGLNLQLVPIEISQQVLKQQAQNQQQPVSLQQLLLQQQPSSSIPQNQLQIIAQAPTQSELCLSSLPIVNGQVQGLPSQVSQGALLSNLGLASNLPTLLPNSCSKPAVDQSTLVYPHKNFASQTPTVLMLDGSQTLNTFPVAGSPYLPAECLPNNQLQTCIIGLNGQNHLPNQQTQAQSKDCACNELPNNVVQNVPYQQCPNRVTLQNKQTQPVQNQGIPLQLQQLPLQSVVSQPVETSPVPSISSHNVPAQPVTVQSQPDNSITNKQTLTSLLLSQLQPCNGNPSQYPNLPFPASSTQGSKSSSMKALLPLLFNLLKEKNGGCGCPNCNCGYMNNMQDFGRNPCMNNNFNNEPFVRNIVPSECNQEANIMDNKRKNAEVIEGYSNQVKYGQGNDKESIINCVDPEKKKYHEKKVKNESIEEYEGEDDYEDSYENEE